MCSINSFRKRCKNWFQSIILRLNCTKCDKIFFWFSIWYLKKWVIESPKITCKTVCNCIDIGVSNSESLKTRESKISDKKFVTHCLTICSNFYVGRCWILKSFVFVSISYPLLRKKSHQLHFHFKIGSQVRLRIFG